MILAMRKKCATASRSRWYMSLFQISACFSPSPCSAISSIASSVEERSRSMTSRLLPL